MSRADLAQAGDQPGATLADLAATANREHALGKQAESAALLHYLNAGDALLAAKAQLGHGEWQPWLRENFDASLTTATNWMRLAANRQQVADSGARTVTEALAICRRRHTERACRDCGATGERLYRLLWKLPPADEGTHCLACAERQQARLAPEERERIAAAIKDGKRDEIAMIYLDLGEVFDPIGRVWIYGTQAASADDIDRRVAEVLERPGEPPRDMLLALQARLTEVVEAFERPRARIGEVLSNRKGFAR